jgi:hypothetical protein
MYQKSGALESKCSLLLTSNSPSKYVYYRDDVTSAQKMAMEEAQQDILGPRELRGLKEVEYDEETDDFIGGSAVERHCRNGDVSRSHTYGPTLQKQTCVIAPPSSAKLASMDTDLDENLESRKSLLKVLSANHTMHTL